MTYDTVIILGIIITLGLMHIAMGRWGVGGGFGAFFAGVIITAAISTSAGISTDFDRCERYSNIANEC